MRFNYYSKIKIRPLSIMWWITRGLAIATIMAGICFAYGLIESMPF